MRQAFDGFCSSTGSRRPGFIQNIVIAFLVAIIVVSVYNRTECNVSVMNEGDVLLRHDKLLGSVDSVTANLESLQKQVEKLRSDITTTNGGVAGGGAVSAARRKKTGKVVLFTLIFGEEAVAKPWLPLFVKSACVSGVDYIIIGDPVLPFELCPNVKHIHISYQALVSYISEELFDGRILWMRDAELYKVIDVKPLLGYLYRNEIAGYKFWGHIDNDMLMGNVMKFLDPLLETHDIITGLRKGDNGKDIMSTWGPFTVYRNVPKITELFRHTPDLFYVFNNHSAFFFDEWGGDSGDYWDYSMTKIINDKHAELGLRWHGGFPLGWDGECEKTPETPRCSECTLTEKFYSKGHTRSSLTWNRTVFQPNEEYLTYDVLLCHFQMGKKIMQPLFDKLTPLQKRGLAEANPLYLGYKEGFHL